MADKKRDILEFVEQSNFEQMIPTRCNINRNQEKMPKKKQNITYDENN